MNVEVRVLYQMVSTASSLFPLFTIIKYFVLASIYGIPASIVYIGILLWSRLTYVTPTIRPCPRGAKQYQLRENFDQRLTDEMFGPQVLHRQH